MAKSTVGKGIALQGTFNKADALWSGDYNRKMNAIASQKKTDQLAQQKASEYITKYLDVHGSGLHNLYQNEARTRSAQYLTKFYEGLQKNPNYASTAEDIQERQKLFSDLDRFKEGSENINKTAAFKMEHPDKIEIDKDVEDIVSRGDYKAFVAKKGDDYFDMRYGIRPVPDWTKVADYGNTDIYDGSRAKTEIVRQNGFDISTDVYDPDKDRWKANLFVAYNSDPVLREYMADKGGFEGISKYVPEPTPQYKPRNISRVPEGGGNGSGFGGGNKSGTVNITQYTRDDGATITEVKDNTSTNDPKLVKIPAGQITANGKVTDSGVTLQDPKIVEQNGKLYLEGIEYNDTGLNIGSKDGDYKILEIQKNAKGLETLKKLSNTFANTLNFELDVNGEWKRVGVNKNINLRNYDDKGLRIMETTTTKTDKKSSTKKQQSIEDIANEFGGNVR